MAVPFIRQDPNDSNKGVGELRLIVFVLIGKRNNEIAIPCVLTFTQFRGDFGFDSIDNLCVERFVIAREVDIPLD